MELVYGNQGNEDADTLAREGSFNSVLGPKPAISISPRVGSLMIRKWLKEKHSKHRAATYHMRQSNLFI
jgi:hypothetical protein